MAAESVRVRTLRDRLLESLRAGVGNLRVNGPLGEARLPHNLHVTFDGVEGERLLLAIGDLAVSTGSACSAGQSSSHVLDAIGAHERPGASIRFGLGRWTTEAEIDAAAERVAKVVRSLQAQLT
jgi:cysteine desulfurase